MAEYAHHPAYTHLHIHTLTHIHKRSPTHLRTHSLTYLLTHTHSLTLTHSLSLTHLLTYSLSHTHSLTLTHALTHSLTLSLTHTPPSPLERKPAPQPTTLQGILEAELKVSHVPIDEASAKSIRLQNIPPGFCSIDTPGCLLD